MSSHHNFMNLSFDDFERLTMDLLSSEWGTPLEIFKTGKDGGVDLRYSHPTLKRKVIVQCKRYAPNAFSNLKNKLEHEELPKIEQLKPEKYVLVTSVALSVNQKDQLYELLKPWCISSGDIYGADEINALLRKHSGVEKNHFKLWLGSTQVLESILHSGIWNKTYVTIEEIQTEISKFVSHDGLNIALGILEEKKYCIILGLPGIGKTTLAKMLLCHYIKNDFEAVVVSSDINEAWQIATEAIKGNKKLVILYDDFLGQIGFEYKKLEKNEDARLLQLFKLVGKHNHLRFILTTREYILADAKRKHSLLADNEIYLETFSLSLGHYSRLNKAMILFNHLYFSDLPPPRVNAIVKSKIYLKIVNHKNYNPRIVSNITDNKKYKHLSDEQYLLKISQDFANPSQVWEHAFTNDIRPECKFILILLWSYGEFVSLAALKSAFSSVYSDKSLTETEELFFQSLKEIDGNFVRTDRYDSDNSLGTDLICRFGNPSIRDFINAKITSNSLIDISRSLTRFNQIINLMNDVHLIRTNQIEEFDTTLFSNAIQLINVEEEQFINTYKGLRLTNLSKTHIAERLNVILNLGNSLGRVDEAYQVICNTVSSGNDWYNTFKNCKSQHIEELLSSITTTFPKNENLHNSCVEAINEGLIIYIQKCDSIKDISKLIDGISSNIQLFEKTSLEIIINNIELLINILFENIDELELDEIGEEKEALEKCNYKLGNYFWNSLQNVSQKYNQMYENQSEEDNTVINVIPPKNEVIEIEFDELFAELINH